MSSYRLTVQKAHSTFSTGGRVLVRTTALAGMLFQAAVGGCEQALADASGALVQAVLGGISEGLADLAQAAIIGAFI